MASTAAIIHDGSIEPMDDSNEGLSLNSVMQYRPAEVVQAQNGATRLATSDRPDPGLSGEGTGSRVGNLPRE